MRTHGSQTAPSRGCSRDLSLHPPFPQQTHAGYLIHRVYDHLASPRDRGCVAMNTLRVGYNSNRWPPFSFGSAVRTSSFHDERVGGMRRGGVDICVYIGWGSGGGVCLCVWRVVDGAKEGRRWVRVNVVQRWPPFLPHLTRCSHNPRTPPQWWSHHRFTQAVYSLTLVLCVIIHVWCCVRVGVVVPGTALLSLSLSLSAPPVSTTHTRG